MIKALISRVKQNYRTIPFPRKEPVLPERFRGLPLLDNRKCSPRCGQACLSVCPVEAINREKKTASIDLGRCLFCGACAAACPEQAITFTRDYRLAVSARANLLTGDGQLTLAGPVDKPRLSLFRQSLRLRQVCAGGCNGCEPDLNVLSTIVFDLGRFGIQFVASPRHADGIVVTGPVTENMKLALQKTWEATPAPKVVIAVGACAISGGIFRDHPEAHNGTGDLFPVDLFIPGCPPHPLTILDGLLRLLGKR